MRENKERSADSWSASAATELPVDPFATHDAGDGLAELALQRRSRRHERELAHLLDQRDVYRVSRADVVKHDQAPNPRDLAERLLGRNPRDFY